MVLPAGIEPAHPVPETTLSVICAYLIGFYWIHHLHLLDYI
ncbi:hypothetical protein SPFL3102_00391 [Sporomusaceae bacterium FL31]|nr:hypothetical protein SPFL3101_01883 [Sporomusaceae bacterium FL31]GCE32602.1 hypothetical protein SPFL3102_00391 [Sporomusaceae bacterium]